MAPILNARASRRGWRAPFPLMTLIAIQAFCTAFFLVDLVDDISQVSMAGWVSMQTAIEGIAGVSLLAAIVVEIRVMLAMLRSEARLLQSLSMARAAVQDVIEAHFDSWALSPSERDVANFLVKGMTISETARLRGCAEGTVKAHLNAIYRKSQTHSRAELLSLLIDAMMGGETDECARPSAQG